MNGFVLWRHRQLLWKNVYFFKLILSGNYDKYMLIIIQLDSCVLFKDIFIGVK